MLILLILVFKLIYDFEDGGSTFGLLSLKAYSKKPTEFEEFQQIGIEPVTFE